MHPEQMHPEQMFDRCTDSLRQWNRAGFMPHRSDADMVRLMVRELATAGGPPAATAIDGHEETPRRVVRTVCAALIEGRGISDRPNLFKDDETIRYVSPFIGDAALGPWPFSEPLTMNDDDAVRWLAIVPAAATVGDDIRRFVRVMFRTEKRHIWMGAARALARLAARDAESRRFLETQWNIAFPEGLPRVWARGRIRDRRPRTAGGHSTRHVLYVAALFATLSDEFSGFFDPAQFASMALPATDASDLSIALFVHAVLLENERTRALVLGALPDRLFELESAKTDDPAVDDAVRTLIVQLGAFEGGARLQERAACWLVSPRWRTMNGVRQLDGILSAAETAAWLMARTDGAHLHRMRELAGGDARQVLELVTGEDRREPKAERLISLLPTLLDRHVFVTTPAPQRWLAIAEIVLLLREPSLGSLPWRSAVARACGAERAETVAEGTITDVGSAELARELFELLGQREFSAILLRHAVLDERLVIALASCRNNFIVKQAALQSERILREKARSAVPGEDQVRFLWKLMGSRTNPALFANLETILRGDENEITPLHEVVAVIKGLDSIRKSAGFAHGRIDLGRVTDVAHRYVELANAAAKLMTRHSAHETVPISRPDVARHRVAEVIGALAADLERAVTVATIGAPDLDISAWLNDVQSIVVGSEARRGFDTFIAFLSGDASSADGLTSTERQVALAFNKVHAAVKGAEISRPRVNAAELREIHSAVAKLWEHFAPLAWSERTVLEAIRIRFDRYAETLRLEAITAERDCEQVQRALETGVDVCIKAPKKLNRRLSAMLDWVMPSDQDVQRNAAVHAAMRLKAKAARSREEQRHSVHIVLGDGDCGDPIDVRHLDATTSRELGIFLLRRFQFADVRRLRRGTPFAASIPTVLSYLAPVLAGVSGGSLVMLDFVAFNDVLLPGHRNQAQIAAGVALFLSWILMVANIGTTNGVTTLRRALPLIGRAATAFAALFLFSTAASATLLWILRNTSVRQVNGVTLPFVPQLLLWSSLAMFLGMFLGVIAQGRTLSSHR